MRQGEIEAMIDETIGETFGKVAGSTVSVTPDKDSDGDPILRVTIAFDPNVTLRDGDLAGFVRHLRSRLAERDIVDFPIVSYVSKAEWGKRKLAAH